MMIGLIFYKPFLIYFYYIRLDDIFLVYSVTGLVKHVIIQYFSSILL